MLLAKTKLNTIKFIISKTIIDWLVSVNNVLKEYNEIKDEIQNPNISVEYAM